MKRSLSSHGHRYTVNNTVSIRYLMMISTYLLDTDLITFSVQTFKMTSVLVIIGFEYHGSNL